MGALVAARKGDRALAVDYLDEAARAAREVGSNSNDLRTGFGPTNVAIHRVSVAVELGDPPEALKECQRGGRIEPAGSVPREAVLIAD
jgi:hypothetical protein